MSITAVFVVLEIITPDPINWTVTLSEKDKNPFGSYLIKERLDDIFNETSYSNLTLYELADSAFNNYLVLAQNFRPSEEDTRALLTEVSEGKNAFIVANYFQGLFADTLDIYTSDYLFQGNIFRNLNKEDTATLRFTNPQLNDAEYPYQRNNSQYYFSQFDSSRAVVLGLNDLERATFLKYPWGEGNIYLSSTPLAFTNNYLVYEDNYQYISRALSYLPPENLHWTNYYQLGRLEARTPLRFILSNEGLRWAYYITLISLIIFIIFEAKRRQRIIPVIEPLRNETLTFVGTISNLYYQNKAHRSIALKKINFFLDQLRTKYFININENNPDFIEKVAHKTGNDEDEVARLFKSINYIRNNSIISEEELLSLNNQIEAFKIN